MAAQWLRSAWLTMLGLDAQLQTGLPCRDLRRSLRYGLVVCWFAACPDMPISVLEYTKQRFFTVEN
jgi:hypothetical protein